MSEFFIPAKKTEDLWYKEPWMLLVLGGPLIVVIAAITTIFIAWYGADQVVSKDYYKQGININKDIIRDSKAIEYKLKGTVRLEQSGKLAMSLSGEIELPKTVLMIITSKSQNSEYEALNKVNLSKVQGGDYEGYLQLPKSAEAMNLNLWHVQIEAHDWRLTGDWRDPMHSNLQLNP